MKYQSWVAFAALGTISGCDQLGMDAAEVRLDGIYYAPSSEDEYNRYLRFYADGSVVIEYSTGTMEQVSQWLGKRYGRGIGTSQIDGDRIEFSDESVSGTLEYSGVVAGNRLELEARSRISDYRSSREYMFVAVEFGERAQLDLSSITNVDTVMIDNGSTVDMLGALKYPLGIGGRFTGELGSPIPAGPLIVIIFKGINPEYQQYLGDDGIRIKRNSAYLWPEGLPYEVAIKAGSQLWLQELKFLREIDPELSNSQLAAEFRVGTE